MNLPLFVVVILLTAPSSDAYMEDDVDTIIKVISRLGRQLIMQDSFMKEHIRGSGSGVKQVRSHTTGHQAYMSGALTSNFSYLMFHDHADQVRTLGMSDVQVVMNGVEFRTLHNDYTLRQPHTSSSEFLRTQNIPFPDVPPEVLRKRSVEAQVEEMKKWFAAFKAQDHSTRDYRKYFKPVLCYLEGYWAVRNFTKTDPLFENLDWIDVIERGRFDSYGGVKGRRSFPFLPTQLMTIKNEFVPVWGQWMYRTLCHPLDRDLPTNRLRVVGDLTAQAKKRLTKEQLKHSPFAYFDLHPFDTGLPIDSKDPFVILDELMGEVPGLNNYGGRLSKNLWGQNEAYQLNGSRNSIVNAAYYHRWQKSDQTDASGRNARHSGFNDVNIFMAMTNHKEVAGMSVDNGCRLDDAGERTCKLTDTQKWTYALPLEIVYLTPLSKWNPYGIQHHGFNDTIVTFGSRDGTKTLRKAFNGSSDVRFYRTPSSFYVGSPGKYRNPASTGDTNLRVGMLNRTGDVVEVASSGARMFTPNVSKVGIVRLRYPLAKPNIDGDEAWKELTALKQLLVHSESYQDIFVGSTSLKKTVKTLALDTSRNTKWPAHAHTVGLTRTDVEYLSFPGRTRTFHTTHNQGHFHTLVLSHDGRGYVYISCDNNGLYQLCPDSHSRKLTVVEETS